MDASLSIQELKDKRIGKIASFIIHIIFLLLIFYPFMQYENPPPGQAGILVSFGEPDAGEGSNQAEKALAEAAPPEETVEEDEPEPVVEDEPEPEPVVEPEPEAPKPVEKEAVPKKEVNEDKNSKEIALKKKKEKERKELLEKERKEKKEADAKKKAADAKKKAEADAKKKAADAKKKAEAAAKQKALEAKKKKEADAKALKDQIGGLFGNNGNGNGDNGNPGSQGDPNGDEDSKILDGISTGTGKIGGGLGNRGGNGPRIKDNSQETGTIVVKVCIDDSGRVVSAKYTQRGSTSASAKLIKLAEANAKKYTFKKGSVEKQCGTITYDFKVK